MSPTPKRQPMVTCPNCGALNDPARGSKYCFSCNMPLSKASEVVPATSPFDAIKRTDERGDYWDARELMPMYGYGADWRNFARCVEQAKVGARNNGLDVDGVFGDVTENPSRRGGRPRKSYRLTRHAAYLTAMEGDPAKPEIAAAKHYFALRTQQAEATEPRLGDDLLTELEVSNNRTAQAIAIARAERRRADHFEQRATVAEGTVREIEGANGLTLRMFHKKYFSEVREREFFEHLYAKGYLIDQRGKGKARLDGSVRDGAEHRHPSFKGKPYLYLHFNGVHGDRRRETTRVRPGQPELDFKAALVRDGLKANGNDDGFLFGIEGGA